jgi:uncharacterized protein (TIGR00303 family)
MGKIGLDAGAGAGAGGKGTEALRDGRVRAVGDAGAAERFLATLEGTPLFACVVASTDTAEIENISAAGATAEKRRYTAALDSEFLLYGRPLTLPEIPRNPLGPPSPVVISRAALLALDVCPFVVDAGSRVPPRTPRLDLGLPPGRSIATGRALDLPDDFRPRCRAAGRMLAERRPWTILAESVPGGTTTALSLLTALGFEARGKVSSSMPGGNHTLKERVVREALEAAALPSDAPALDMAAAVGDPMQPALALMALEASLHGPVVLGGGTQMAAVYALMARLVAEGERGDLGRVAIATTRWVAADEAADFGGILAQVAPPAAAFAAWLDFSSSRLPGLARYEEGLVKEGVGAGAAAFAVFTAGGLGHDEFVRCIEEVTVGADGKS